MKRKTTYGNETQYKRNPVKVKVIMCATKPLGDSRRQASCTRRSRRRTNMHRASARVGASWTRTVGAAVAMMQWRLRRGKRARSWMSSLHSWEQAAADSAEEGQTRGWETLARPCPNTLHGNTDPGVSASPAASRVMTFGDISHTSVRRCSHTGEEAPTPYLLWAWTKWGEEGLLLFHW